MADAQKHNRPTTLDSVASVVLAGSYHWTGSQFEQLCPRPLLPVALKPLIEYVLDWLATSGVGSTTICANGSTAAIRDHLAGTYRSSMAIDYLHDSSPRGAAGCVKDAAAASAAQWVIVTDGNTIPTLDLQALIAHHRSSRTAITMVVRQRPSSLPRVPHLEPTGTYVFSREVLDAIPATSYQDIKENLIPRLYAEGAHIELFTADDVSPRALNASTYLALNRWMIQRLGVRVGVPNQARQLVAHPTARVDPRATIVGPVVLGEGVQVDASAVIVGPSVIGAGTTVTAGAVIARSVVWEDCVIGQRAMVDQCVLADRARVEPETAVAGMLRVGTPDRQPNSAYGRFVVSRPAGAIAKPALS